MCNGNELCGTCNNPAVVAWMSCNRHSRPPFGDDDQMRVAVARRKKAFWQVLKAGDSTLVHSPEFGCLFSGDETARRRGVEFTRMEFLGRLAADPDLLRMPAAYLPEEQALRIIRRMLIHVRARMKSSAIESSTAVSLWALPSILVRAMGAAAVERHIALIAEVNRVKALPTGTKRAVKHRELEKKTLRREIVAFAQGTFEGVSLESITVALLTQLKTQNAQFEGVRKAA